MKKSWLQKGSEFTLVEGEFDVVSKIKRGIYNVTLDMNGVWHLEKFQDKFEFPFKIYGLQSDFINYVLKTYNHTEGNLGILLNGTKGAGKTVCAKVLANLLELPVIIIKGWGKSNQSLIEYLGSFNFDCVLFFDEFEKQFEKEDNTILQIMDGVYNSVDSRRVFLLTTNELNINRNLISRPSRVKYIKSFTNLDKDTVKEYLMDNLEDKSCIEEALSYVDTLSDSTIDILKAVVSEINIHGFQEFKKAKSWFNVTTEDYRYICWTGYIDTDDVQKVLRSKQFDGLISAFNHDIKSIRFPMTNPKSDPGYKDLSDEEKRKKCEEFENYSRRYFDGLKKVVISSEIKLDKLSEGDTFDGEEIISIDRKKDIIVTYCDTGYFYVYNILNSNQIPSLWGEDNINSLAYGYLGL